MVTRCAASAGGGTAGAQGPRAAHLQVVSTPRLTAELVPSTCWWSNLRSNMPADEWAKCKAFVRKRSGDRCELCGGRGRQWPVECHEVWAYDETTWTQTLEGLIALCPPCHEVKHIGRAETVGNLERAKNRLMVANATGCSSIYGGNLPTTPWTTNADGRGPAWSTTTRTLVSVEPCPDARSSRT